VGGTSRSLSPVSLFLVLPSFSGFQAAPDRPCFSRCGSYYTFASSLFSDSAIGAVGGDKDAPLITQHQQTVAGVGPLYIGTYACARRLWTSAVTALSREHDGH
jgi:hypothetical protein